MANHLVDARAHALRKSFIIQTGRNRVVILAILHANVIDILGRDAGTDDGCHSIQTARVHFAGNANAGNLLGRFNHIARGHQLPLVFPVHHLLIELCNGLPRKTVPSFFLEIHILLFKLVQKYNIYSRPTSFIINIFGWQLFRAQ